VLLTVLPLRLKTAIDVVGSALLICRFQRP
jgi:hypothetical protein